MRLAEILESLNNKAPFDWAEDWDNVGLIAGDQNAEVNRAVVSVNLGTEALKAAKTKRAKLIISHHPPIFKPTLSVTKSKYPYLYEALRNEIQIVSLHTNFDLASLEMNQRLASQLGFEWTDFLAHRQSMHIPRSIEKFKFITYVPKSHLEKVRKAVCDAGAGVIGDYTDCSFSWMGEGTFKGGTGARPYIGKAQSLEKTKEYRLEVLTSAKSQASVIRAAREAHPYEEMAYDLVPQAPSQDFGYGFLAQRKGSKKTSNKSTKTVFHNLVKSVKQVFRLETVMVVGPGLKNLDMPVSKIAFSPGSGSSFVHSAISKKADVYICGEVGYHQMLEARSRGLTLVVLGHSYSERFFVDTVSQWCSDHVKVDKVYEEIHGNI